MNTAKRIIDANANRVREALRVLEESARFIVQDTNCTSQLKQMRHDFAQALPDAADLLAHRDTPSDIGTTISTQAEQSRRDLSSVIAAAGSRLGEALRVIEEYSKLDGLGPGYPQLAQVSEQIRYQSYDITQQLTLALGGHCAKQWRLCLLLTQALCTHHPWQSVLDQAIKRGADCIQVREKDMDAGRLLKHLQAVIQHVDGRADVIVNDHADLALLAGAQGVHLGQSDLGPRDARKLLGKKMIIGVSTSNLEQAKQAKANGADYCGVGPMFATTTKHKPDLAGPQYLSEYLAWSGLPHLAIGGIKPENIVELAQTGCQGIAVSAAICSAENPGKMTEELASGLSHDATPDSHIGISASS